VIERDGEPAVQILRRNVVFDAIGAAIKAALAPAREVEHRLAQRLGGDCAGVNAHAADAVALLNHQHGFLDLGCLDRRTAAGGALPTTIRS